MTDVAYADNDQAPMPGKKLSVGGERESARSRSAEHGDMPSPNRRGVAALRDLLGADYS